MADESPIKVYIANLGKYNEGINQGGWLGLPATNHQIAEFLRDTVGVNERYEEYAIHDYDLSNLPEELRSYHISEYDSLDNLNMFAAELENRSKFEQKAIGAYFENEQSLEGDELLNLAAQADEIPLFTYDYDNAYTVSAAHFGETNVEWNTAERNYAFHALENYYPELNDALMSSDTHGCFDYEAWGKAEAKDNNVTLYDDCFYEGLTDGPDLDYYSHEELEARSLMYIEGDYFVHAQEFEAQYKKDFLEYPRVLPNYSILKQTPDHNLTLAFDSMQMEPSYIVSSNFNLPPAQRYDNALDALKAYNKAEMAQIYRSPVLNQDKSLVENEKIAAPKQDKPTKRPSPAELGKRATERANAANASREVPTQAVNKHVR